MALSNFSTSNYITIASALVSTAPFTIACWFNSTSATFGQNMIAGNAASALNYFGLSLDGATTGDPVGIYARGSGGTVDIVNTTSGYSINTWQHACGVFESSTSRSVFLNGGSKNSSSASVIPLLVDKINIGVYRQSGSSGFDSMRGSLAEIGIWSAALTDDEVASLAKGFTPDQIRPQSLVAYLPLVRTNQDIKGNSWTTAGTLTVADHPRVYA
jgi:hypothetical protein